MCFGLPLLFMVLRAYIQPFHLLFISSFHSDYVVQGHRFDIIEGYGCRPTTYFSIAALFIVWIPPILMAIAALIFAGLSLESLDLAII